MNSPDSNFIEAPDYSNMDSPGSSIESAHIVSSNLPPVTVTCIHNRYLRMVYLSSLYLLFIYYL